MYEEFAGLLFTESNKSSLSDYRNALCYARVEFACLQHRDEMKKNNPVSPFIEKAIRLLDMQIAYVERQIQWTEAKQKCPLCKPENPYLKLKWTGNVVEWVELIYALYSAKRINNGKTSLKELFQQMGEVFDFEVKEFSNYFMNIKHRTDEHRTKFIDSLRNTVLARMEDADRKPSRK